MSKMRACSSCAKTFKEENLKKTSKDIWLCIKCDQEFNEQTANMVDDIWNMATGKSTASDFNKKYKNQKRINK